MRLLSPAREDAGSSEAIQRSEEDGRLVMVSGGRPLVVTLERLEDLNPHEEFTERLRRRLTDQIRSDGELKDPLIVDRESLTVLDGMHRLAALKSLGASMAAVCLVDYSDPGISVGRWTRVLDDSSLQDAGPPVLGHSWTETEPARCLELLEEDGASVAVVSNSRAQCCVDGQMAAREVTVLVSELEGKARRGGSSVEYRTEEDASELLAEGRVECYITYRRISKEDVVEAGTQGVLLAPKSTRHVLSARPMGVGVPLPTLRREDVEQAREVLLEMLRTRDVRRIDADVEVHGRTYPEEVYYFD